MDRIAIISDIHGNMPAFEAVLTDIRGRGADRIICLGDLVGKGPHSDLAVDRVRETCDVVVRGNWDDFIGNSTENPTLLWHQKRLGKERLAYLKDLSFVYEFWMSGRFVRLFHASPRSVYERIQPWDPVVNRLSLLDASPLCAEQRQADVAGYGDVHNAFLQHLNQRLLFNTGSVGNPLDMTQASYVLLEGSLDRTETAAFAIAHMRVPYDIELAVRQAVKEEMPELAPYAEELRTGRYRGKK